MVGNESRVRVQSPSPETRYVHMKTIFSALPQFKIIYDEVWSSFGISRSENQRELYRSTDVQ